MKRASYQNGSVVLKKRMRGPDVWVFRYYEDGKQKSRQIGTTAKFRTKAAAEKSISAFRDEINDRAQGLSIASLCDRFEKAELDIRPDTRDAYLSFLRRVKADLGKQRIEDVAADIPAIEAWLNALTKHKSGKPLSKTSKRHVKNFMHLLFEFAMKHGLFPLKRNPIQLVQIRGKHAKVRVHTLLTPEQFQQLMDDPDLPDFMKAMLNVMWYLGIRRGEALGLRWDAIDFEKKIIHIRVSSVGKHHAAPKTDASEAALPMPAVLEAVLLDYRESQTASDGTSIAVDGWLFGNRNTQRPYWGGALQRLYLIPAGIKIGIPRLGFHDFRHTYRDKMGEADTPAEMQQRFMRHDDITTTFKYGRGRVTPAMREHQAKVVEMLKPRRMA